MKRFNECFALVTEDRASPQATAVEGKLLEFCNSKSHMLMVTVQMRWCKEEQRRLQEYLKTWEPWDIEEV